MRSVEAYLCNTNPDNVADFLTQAFPSQAGPPWIDAISSSVYLYIDFNPCSKTEQDQQQWSELVHNLGCEPQVVVTADVSGRHPGDERVKQFVCGLLTAFEGVARNDYTFHCWSHKEISNNHKIQGHRFFDYQGWFDQENTHPS